MNLCSCCAKPADGQRKILAGKVGQHGRSDITKINTLLLFTMATDGEIDIRGQYVLTGNLSNLSNLTGSYRSSKVTKADGRSPPVGPPIDSPDVRTRQSRGRVLALVPLCWARPVRFRHTGCGHFSVVIITYRNRRCPDPGV